MPLTEFPNVVWGWLDGLMRHPGLGAPVAKRATGLDTAQPHKRCGTTPRLRRALKGKEKP